MATNELVDRLRVEPARYWARCDCIEYDTCRCGLWTGEFEDPNEALERAENIGLTWDPDYDYGSWLCADCRIGHHSSRGR